MFDRQAYRWRWSGVIVLVTGLLLGLLAGCLAAPPGVSQPGLREQQATVVSNSGPQFLEITTSSKGFAKSDCSPTAITVTATISAPDGLGAVWLWYRVGAEEPFTQTVAQAVDSTHYVASVKGLDVPGSAYGVWEFYLTAQDPTGQQSQSAVDTTVQLLPCVN